MQCPYLAYTITYIKEMLAGFYRLYSSASFLTVNSRFYYLNRFRVILIWARPCHCLWQLFFKTCKLVTCKRLSGHVLTASHFADAFHFFECRHNQKQPETAQKVDLKLRDVNTDRNGSKSSGSCGL